MERAQGVKSIFLTACGLLARRGWFCVNCRGREGGREEREGEREEREGGREGGKGGREGGKGGREGKEMSDQEER